MPDTILDTLEKLIRHGHGLVGYCLDCKCGFNVIMADLITQRGPQSPVVRMRPIPCAHCGSVRTEYRITAPSKGRG
jgi:hypothetical protein